jgi:cysteine desulfurase
MREPLYLDYNATAPIRPEAADAVTRALGVGANPSSIHAAGRKARALIEASRQTVAEFVGASAQSLAFTSGGTEANALAIHSAVAAGFSPIIVSAIEHEAVVETAKVCGGFDPIPVDHRGVADLDWLERRLEAEAGRRPFVALMLANNETGVIQPVAEAARLVREANGWLHIDAVQAAGKIAIDFNALGADSLALSAHKLGGPQGVGALAWGERAVMSRVQHGGGQERGRRAGTENLSGIAGFAAAVEMSVDRSAIEAQAPWRDAAAARLAQAGATIAGEGADRLANTLCLAVSDWSSELQVIALDLMGVMVSAGAACSSGKVKPSRVLEAMGFGDKAAGALRASGGWATTEADWARFADAWIEARTRHAGRRLSAA